MSYYIIFALTIATIFIPLNDIGNENPESILYIAMAGSHQIWALALEDCTWLKNRCPKNLCNSVCMTNVVIRNYIDNMSYELIVLLGIKIW